MALDGFAIAGIAKEISQKLTGGKIAKIAQPEADELLLTVKNNGENHRLLISASASLPLVYLTDQNKTSPQLAPTFCMVLRKHIGNGRILSVTQPGLERILTFEIEHLDEMGDIRHKKLIVELMGKYSNIIFIQEDQTIIDSIKRIPSSVSSVREVLPGRPYFLPESLSRIDPLQVTQEVFSAVLKSSKEPLFKAIYGNLTGFSPVLSSELLFRAGLDPDHPAEDLSELELIHLYHTMQFLLDDVREGNFNPVIYRKNGKPEEFSALPLNFLSGTCQEENCASCSRMLSDYYSSRDAVVRMRQKSSELRRVVSTALERNVKKCDLQKKQLKDTEKRDKFRLYGELLNTYVYSWNGEDTVFPVINYYDGKECRIPMDPAKTGSENAAAYFAKYGKLKRTYEALTGLIAGTEAEISHLDSISTALDIARAEEDLNDIKEELRDFGYIHKRGPKDKKPSKKSRPVRYVTEQGFTILVGKNNYQNEELSFKIAQGNDWWFHAKGIPGSHVIVKTEGKSLPDAVFEAAARAAAYYSKGRENDKVEVDYVEKKQLRKVAGAAPGFVIYHTNYSMVVSPSLAGLTEVPY